jgi:hypothetical protein
VVENQLKVPQTLGIVAYPFTKDGEALVAQVPGEGAGF